MVCNIRSGEATTLDGAEMVSELLPSRSHVLERRAGNAVASDFGAGIPGVGTMSGLAASEVIVRLASACLVGGAVGLDREARQKAAGLRTHIPAIGTAALVVVVLRALGILERRLGSKGGGVTAAYGRLRPRSHAHVHFAHRPSPRAGGRTHTTEGR